jgi:uncharacterized protein (DUF58 family)
MSFLAGSKKDRVKPDITMKRTAYGWVCVFLLIWLPLAAMVTANNFLFIIFAMVIGLVLVSRYLAKRNIDSLQIVRNLPEEIFAETSFSVQYSLRTDHKPWGAVTIAMEEDYPLLDSGKSVNLRHVPVDEDISATGIYYISSRGAHQIEEGRLSSSFPFGLARYSRKFGSREPVLVFPRVDPVADTVPFDFGNPGQGVEQIDPFGTIPYYFRQYVQGDPYKHIEWKMTARTGELVTKVHSEEGAGEIVIRLAGSASERAISRAASLVVHFAKLGTPISLEGPGLKVEPGVGKDFTRKLLTILALWENRPAEVGNWENPLAKTVEIDSRGEFHWNRSGE